MALPDERKGIGFGIFMDDEERREYGGSNVLEFQYCKHPQDTDLKTIVDDISFWEKDSLYSSDESDFYKFYSHIFTGGTYGNLNTGPLDSCGINYYSPELVRHIMRALENEKPPEYKILQKWMKKAGRYNGIYILGM